MRIINASAKAVELVNRLCDPSGLEEKITFLEVAEDQLQDFAYEDGGSQRSHDLYDIAYQIKLLKKSFVELKLELENGDQGIQQ